MALTKAVAAVDACQEIAQNTIVEGVTVDLAAVYSAALHIWIALTNATAHTGTRVRVQVSANTTGDEDWSDIYDLIGITGTTNLEVITNNPLAIGDGPANAITVASLTGYAAGAWAFLEDVSTFANSEWVYVVSTSVEAGDDHIHTLDGVTRQHAANSIMNSIAAVYVVDIPEWANRCRIIYDNTYDADGATVAVRSAISKLTGV